jgi:hypothetical protein
MSRIAIAAFESYNSCNRAATALQQRIAIAAFDHTRVRVIHVMRRSTAQKHVFFCA